MSVATLAGRAWRAWQTPNWRRFRAALNDPAAVQWRLLQRYLRTNADTAFGLEHDFASITSIEAFQRRIPLRSYDEFEPYITRIRAGEPRVLTAQPVRRLMPSSGSTAARKLIPYTDALQAEFSRGIGPWIVDLHRSRPDLSRGRHYWSISPALSRAHEDSAVPIGFEEDSAYLGSWLKRLVERTLAVPGDVAKISDLDAFRRETMRHLLAARDLRLISVWHPSFLTLLLDATDTAVNWREAWPHLSLISCWADGNAAGAAAALAERFPGVAIQPKGLIATEAFVTLPFEGYRPIVARSHFFEFVDDTGASHLVHELRDGAEYSVVVTTGGGVYRYRLHDRVRVEGFLGRTPSLRFIGKDDRVSDRFGEKLSEGFVAGLLRELLGDAARFAMLAPDGDHYTLYGEGAWPDAAKLDAALSRNPHYAYCRSLGQLARVRVFAVARDAHETYIRHQHAKGQRLGDIKAAALSTDDGWSTRFTGGYRV